MGNPGHGEGACFRYAVATAEEGKRALRKSTRLAEEGDNGTDCSVRRSLEWRGEFVWCLGEARYGRDNGRVEVLDLLACADLPVSEGVMLTRRAHEEFLWTSGILRDVRTAARRGEDVRRQAEEIRSRHATYPVEGGLNRAICEALIGLNARVVVILSEDLEKGGLRSIPEVKDAVRDAWLSLHGLERQVEAAARGEELPTWPLLIYSQAKI